MLVLVCFQTLLAGQICRSDLLAGQIVPSNHLSSASATAAWLLLRECLPVCFYPPALASVLLSETGLMLALFPFSIIIESVDKNMTVPWNLGDEMFKRIAGSFVFFSFLGARDQT